MKALLVGCGKMGGALLQTMVPGLRIGTSLVVDPFAETCQRCHPAASPEGNIRTTTFDLLIVRRSSRR